MTDKHRSFLSHAAVYGLGTVLLQAASFFLLPLYTHYLTPADFGTLEILNRSGQVIGILLMINGIGTATFTFYCQAKTTEEHQKVISTLVVLWGILLLGGGLLAVACARPLGSFLGVDNPTLAAIGILVPFFESASLIPMVLAQARTESVFFVCVSLAMFVSRVVMLVAAVAYLGWGIWGVLIASILNSILFGVALNVREFWKTSFHPDMAVLRQTTRFALPFVASGLCFFMMASGDRFFLVKAAGAEELGVYALGYKLALAVGMLSFTPLFKVWSAHVYDVFAQQSAAVRVGHVFTLLLAAYLFVGLVLCTFIDNVVVAVASPAYMGASAVVAPIVFAQFFNCAATLMDGVFYVHRRTHPKAWIALASAVVTFALYATVVPRYGALGAAYASLGGFAFHATATFCMSQRVFRIQYEPARVGAMVLLTILLISASRWLGVGLYSLVPKGIIVVSWIYAAVSIGIINSDDKQRCSEIICTSLDVVRRLLAPVCNARNKPGRRPNVVLSETEVPSKIGAQRTCVSKSVVDSHE